MAHGDTAPGRADLLSHLTDYELRHLVGHLASLGHGDVVHRLLWLEDVERSGTQRSSERPEVARAAANAWYAAKATRGDLAGYLDDLQVGWGLAEQQVRREMDAAEPVTAAAMPYRYALSAASVNSTAAGAPPAFLAAMVGGGEWQADQALAHARRVPDTGSRAEALAALVPHLGGKRQDIVDETIATVRGMPFGYPRVSAYVAVLRVLDEAERAPLAAETIDVVREISDTGWRASALAALAPHLPDRLAGEALTIAGDVDSELERAQAISALLAHRPDDLADVALADVERIEDANVRDALTDFVTRPVPEPIRTDALREVTWSGLPGWRTRALALRTPRLREPLLAQCLAVARRLGDHGARVHTLAVLLPHVCRDARSEVVYEILRDVAAHSGDPVVVEALTHMSLLPLDLTDTERRAVIVVALEIPDPIASTQVIAAIGAGFDQPLRDDVFADLMRLIQSEEDEAHRAALLTVVAPHLPESFVADAVSEARGMQSAEARASSFRALAARVGDPMRQALLASSLRAAREITDEEQRARELIALVSRLPPDLAAAADAAGQAIEDDHWRMLVRSETIPYLPVSALSEAFVQTMGDDAATWPVVSEEALRIHSIAALAPLLPQSMLAEMLGSCRGIREPDERCAAFMALLPHAQEPERAAIVDHACRAAREIADDLRRASSMAAVAAYAADAVETELIREAASTAERLRPADAALVLARLAHHAADDQSQSLFDRALMETERVGDPEERATLLAALLPTAPAYSLGHLLRIADRLLEDDDPRGWVPDSIIHGRQADPAAAGATMLRNWGRRANLLAALAGRMPPSLLPELSRAMQRVGDAGSSVDALVALSQVMSASDADAVLADAFDLIRTYGDDPARASALPRLAQSARVTARHGLIEESLAIEQEPLRAVTLGELARSFAGTHNQALRDGAEALQDSGWRAYALALAASPLPEGLAAEVARELWYLEDELRRSIALEAVLPALSPKLLSEMLDRIQVTDEPGGAFQALEKLAPYLDEQRLHDAFAAGLAEHDDADRLAALASLATAMPPSLMPEAIALVVTAGGLKSRHHAKRTLTRLAPRLPADVAENAVAEARAQPDPAWRSDLLVLLAPISPEPTRPALYAEALAALAAVDDDWAKSYQLSELWPFLPDPLLSEALGVARSIRDADRRASALIAGLPRLAGPRRLSTLAETAHAAREIADAQRRASALGNLLSEFAPEDQIAVCPEVAGIARSVTDHEARLDLLLPCLAAMAGRAEPDLMEQAADAAHRLEDTFRRHELLAATAQHLVSYAAANPQVAWELVHPLPTLRRRADVLGDVEALTPALAVVASPSALRDIASAIVQVERWWP